MLQMSDDKNVRSLEYQMIKMLDNYMKRMLAD